MTPSRSGRGVYPLLLALGVLDASGYSVIVPVAPAIAHATGAGPATIGLLVASFPTGMVLGFALAGSVVGRRGRQVLARRIPGIVTAMVVWSQIGMVGYLLGPLAGGLVAEGLGYAFIGTVSAAAGLLVVALLRTARSPVSEAAAEGNLRHVT
jgi:MFS family permease